MNNAAVFHLLHLADPSLPIGAFAHSSGLETYVINRLVHDGKSAKAYIISQLYNNTRYTDAAFVSLSYKAAGDNNYEQLKYLDDLCTAVKVPHEIRQGSRQLGIRLLKIFHGKSNMEISDFYFNAIRNKELHGHYTLAFGLYASLHDIKLEEALVAYYFNTITGMVTNCVKLIPLSQQDGQELIFLLEDMIEELVELSLEPDMNMVGICCTGFDIRSMQHERLYSRLYIS